MNRFLTVFAAVILTTGCEIFSTQYSIKFVFPEEDFADSCVFEPEAWTISWLSEGGVRHRTVSSADSITLSLPKERPILVLAQPESGSFSDFWKIRPAGAVAATGETTTGRIQLSWEDGFSAWYLLRITEAGINPEAIHISRFCDVVRDRGENRPWEIDLRTLGEHLTEGKLWVYSFHLSSLVNTTISLPQGTWHPEYPPSEPLTAGVNGWTGEIGVGVHAFLCGEDSSVALVDVDERGEVTLLIEEP